jgi:hypothetical protein
MTTTRRRARSKVKQPNKQKPDNGTSGYSKREIEAADKEFRRLRSNNPLERLSYPEQYKIFAKLANIGDDAAYMKLINPIDVGGLGRSNVDFYDFATWRSRFNLLYSREKLRNTLLRFF